MYYLPACTAGDCLQNQVSEKTLGVKPKAQQRKAREPTKVRGRPQSASTGATNRSPINQTPTAKRSPQRTGNSPPATASATSAPAAQPGSPTAPRKKKPVSVAKDVTDRLYSNSKQVSLMERVMHFINDHVDAEKRPDANHQAMAANNLFRGGSSQGAPQYVEYTYGGATLKEGHKFRRPNTASHNLGVSSGFVRNLRTRMHRTTGYGSSPLAEGENNKYSAGTTNAADTNAANENDDLLEAHELQFLRNRIGLAPSCKCALCEIEFALPELPTRVAFKSILDMRSRWKFAYESKGCNPVPSPRSGNNDGHVPATKLYSPQPICRFCSQFFGVYLGERFEEGRQDQLTPDAPTAEHSPVAHSPTFGEHFAMLDTQEPLVPTLASPPARGSRKSIAQSANARRSGAPYTTNDLVSLPSSSVTSSGYTSRSSSWSSKRSSSGSSVHRRYSSSDASSRRSSVTSRRSRSSHSSRSHPSRSHSRTSSTISPHRSPSQSDIDGEDSDAVMSPFKPMVETTTSPKKVTVQEETNRNKQNKKPVARRHIVPAGKKNPYPARDDSAAALPGKITTKTYLRTNKTVSTKKATTRSSQQTTASPEKDTGGQQKPVIGEGDILLITSLGDSDDETTNGNQKGPPIANAHHNQSSSSMLEDSMVSSTTNENVGQHPPEPPSKLEESTASGQAAGTKRAPSPWDEMSRHAARRQKYINEVAKKKRAQRKAEEDEAMKEAEESLLRAEGKVKNNKEHEAAAQHDCSPKKKVVKPLPSMKEPAPQSIKVDDAVHAVIVVQTQNTTRLPLPHCASDIVHSKMVPFFENVLKCEMVNVLEDDNVSEDALDGCFTAATEANALTFFVYVGHTVYNPARFNDVLLVGSGASDQNISLADICKRFSGVAFIDNGAGGNLTFRPPKGADAPAVAVLSPKFNSCVPGSLLDTFTDTVSNILETASTPTAATLVTSAIEAAVTLSNRTTPDPAKPFAADDGAENAEEEQKQRPLPEEWLEHFLVKTNVSTGDVFDAFDLTELHPSNDKDIFKINGVPVASLIDCSGKVGLFVAPASTPSDDAQQPMAILLEPNHVGALNEEYFNRMERELQQLGIVINSINVTCLACCPAAIVAPRSSKDCDRFLDIYQSGGMTTLGGCKTIGVGQVILRALSGSEPVVFGCQAARDAVDNGVEILADVVATGEPAPSSPPDADA